MMPQLIRHLNREQFCPDTCNNITYHCIPTCQLLIIITVITSEHLQLKTQATGLLQHCCHHIFILSLVDRARRVHQPFDRREAQGMPQSSFLQ
jgi:hypothetical protein